THPTIATNHTHCKNPLSPLVAGAGGGCEGGATRRAEGAGVGGPHEGVDVDVAVDMEVDVEFEVEGLGRPRLNRAARAARVAAVVGGAVEEMEGGGREGGCEGVAAEFAGGAGGLDERLGLEEDADGEEDVACASASERVEEEEEWDDRRMSDPGSIAGVGAK
ncbi:hypothetical protein HDU93_003939, partial [Gonapodya sp. JEL0774]